MVYVGLTFDYRLEKTSVTFNPYIDEVSRISSKQIMKSNLTRLRLHFLIRKCKTCGYVFFTRINYSVLYTDDTNVEMFQYQRE